MRVLHVIPSLDPQDGGPSVALPLMARSLAMQGVEVDVVTTIREVDARAQRITPGTTLTRDGYTVRYFARETERYKVSLPLREWVRTHVEDYTLVHTHALFSFAPLAAAAAARRAHVPYVMRPLGLLNDWGMRQRRPLLKRLSFGLRERPALDHAAAIHYTSLLEQQEAARFHLHAKALVIPLGIDTEAFAAPLGKEAILQKFPAARGRRVVLYLSRLDPKKGIEGLLEAFARVQARVPDAILMVAGSGNADYEDSLRAKAGELRLDSHVIWAGFLEGADKLGAFSIADVFVLPSFSENFGIALLEAMAAGRACVAAEGVALARECGDAVVLVPPDSADLAEALQRLLQDNEARRTLGARATRIARERWSLQATGARLAAAYRELAQSQ